MVSLIASLIFVFSTLCLGQDIHGTVIDAFTARAVSGCTISIQNSSLQATTDQDGYFSFSNLDPGTYNLVFSHNDYSPYTLTDVFLPVRRPYEIKLTPRVKRLPTSFVRASAVRRNPEMTTSTRTFLNSELMRAPGALADVQRIVQNLPSVVSGADNVNEVIVRGGMQGENLFIIDNVEVINPNHFADQNSGGGVLSLLNPLLVSELTFNAGAPAAKYGGKASSVIDVTLREGNSKRIFGGMDLGVTGAGIHLEGPSWENGNFIFSANKSYLDLVARFDPGTAVPKYWAGQGKLTHHYATGKLSLLTLLGDSDIEISDSDQQYGLEAETIISGSSNYLVGFNWEHDWSESLSSVLTLSTVGNKFSSYGKNRLSGADDTIFYSGIAVKQQQLKMDTEYLINDRSKLSGGFFGKYTLFDMDRQSRFDTLKTFSEETTYIFTNNDGDPVYSGGDVYDRKSNVQLGGFLSSAWNFDTGLQLIAGVRSEHFNYTNNTIVEPRTALKYTISQNLHLNSSFGIQHQFPDYSKLIAHSDNKDLRAKRALSGIVGLDFSPDLTDINFTLEAFYKHYNNPERDSLHFSADTQFNFLRTNRKIQSGQAKSYGIEFFSEKKLTENFSFTLAYSYSQSLWNYRSPEYNEWFRGDYDYRNVFTFTGGYMFELGENPWYRKTKENLLFKLLLPIAPVADRQEFSLRFRYRGGRPSTPHHYDTLHNRWVYDISETNTDVMDHYHRLDFRWERRYVYERITMVFYLEVQNLYNRKNIWMQMYNDDFEKPVKIYQLPVFPSGGFIIGF